MKFIVDKINPEECLFCITLGQLPANKLAGLQKPKLTSLSASSTTLRENV